MELFRMFEPKILKQAMGHQTCILLDKDNGCVGECMAGMSLYQTEEFPEPQKHTFQEGFYVVEGEGFALIGEEEIAIRAGMAFLVPTGKAHAIRKGKNCSQVQVFWFHSE